MGLYVDIYKDLGRFKLEVQFEAREGITGLLGASGCGKSLTLKCIAGVEKPDRGVIRLDDVTLFDSEKGIDLPPQKRRVGYLFQNYALFPHMTVEQNVLCGLHRRRDRKERERILSELYDLLQLRGLEQLRPAQLSGGQAQRVALARILVTEPKLLLLDEPFSALDSHLRDRLQPQMQNLLRQFGYQTLLVTHDRNEAYRMCEELRIFGDGRIIRAGTTKEVFQDPGSATAARLTGCKNIAPAKRVGAYQVEVPQWGITLHTDRPVPEELNGIGLRAHAFRTEGEGQGVPVVCTQVLEEPFEWNILFRFLGQSPESGDLWWRMPKDRRPEILPEALIIGPSDILYLTEEGDVSAWNNC